MILFRCNFTQITKTCSRIFSVKIKERRQFLYNKNVSRWTKTKVSK